MLRGRRRHGQGRPAEPEESGPGLVVLQEWWGLDDSVKKLVDRFAEEGFVALAPDLYHGETTEQPDEAEQKLMALDMDEAEKEMRGAVKALLEHDKCDGSVGSVGFCMGGGLSVWAAATNPDIGAAVTYYYVMPHGKPDFSDIDAPVLGHFGTNDDFVSVEDAKALESDSRRPGSTPRSSSTRGRATPSRTTTTGSAPTTRTIRRRRGRRPSTSSSGT